MRRTRRSRNADEDLEQEDVKILAEGHALMHPEDDNLEISPWKQRDRSGIRLPIEELP